jgi:hypothetical protein
VIYAAVSCNFLHSTILATLLEVYKQILEKRGLRGASLRGVNEDQLAQIATLAAKIPPRQQAPQVSINPASVKAEPEIRRQPSGKFVFEEFLGMYLESIGRMFNNVLCCRRRSGLSNGPKQCSQFVLRRLGYVKFQPIFYFSTSGSI